MIVKLQAYSNHASVLKLCKRVKIWHSILKQFSEKIFSPKDFDIFKVIKNVNKSLK